MGNENGKQEGISRRALCAGACAGVATLALCGLKAVPAQAQVRPPGGQDEGRLLALCIRCARCIESCPWRLLRGAQINEGILGAGIPVTDFSINWCDFCKSFGGSPRCVESCPTGALQLHADGEPIVIGKAEIVQEWCLPWATGEKCKKCYHVCPREYRAIKLDKKGRPTVDLDKCVGCGACQKACPIEGEGSLASESGLRAITVKPVSA